MAISITDTTNSKGLTAAATFVATRRELSGAHALLGSAEIAREVCREARRTFSVLAVTAATVRRVDGWIGESGVVTHPASPNDARPRVGSVCDRDLSTELVLTIGAALVGGWPTVGSSSGVDVSCVGAIGPDDLPTGVRWVVVVSAAAQHVDAVAERIVVAGADGLAVGSVTSVESGVSLRPTPFPELERRVGVVLGRRPRTVAALLADG